MRDSRKRSEKTPLKVFAVLLTGVLIVVILGSLYRASRDKNRSQNDTEIKTTYRNVEVDGVKYKYNTDLINVLCIGVDADDLSSDGQADAVYLLVFDRGEKHIRILTVSRDTIAPVQVLDLAGKKVGWTDEQLALSYAYGKTVSQRSLMTAESLSRLLHDIPIVYYAAGSIGSIELFQNLVGTFQVQIPDDGLTYLGEEYKKGNTVTIDANNAESFLRSRKTEENFSNSERMQRQKVYIEAYLAKFKELLQNDFTGMVGRMEELQGHLGTNVGLDETEAFAQMFLTYDCDLETDYYTVEGTAREGVFHDEFIVDEEALSKLVLKLFYKKGE